MTDNTKDLSEIKKPTIFVAGSSGDIVFFNEEELLRFTDDGEIYLQGQLIAEDKAIYAALLEFFRDQKTD